ncbi:MAG: HD-GYP domain-containing protein [Treponema sp.]|nr:HD-GYP domain-containing protein [Treponema sp.]
MKKFISSIKEEVKSLKPLNIIVFAAIIALYFFAGFSASHFAVQRGFFEIWGSRMPLASLAGVFSSLSNIFLISMVVFYGKLGFLVSMGISVIRFARLAWGIIVVRNSPSIPGTVLSLFALIVLILIYRRNEKIALVQKEKFDLIKKEQENLSEMFLETAKALVSAIDAKDRYTHGHSTRVANYSKEIARRAGKSEQEIKDIYFSALLHDVGKIGVDEAIINKKGKLTEEEFNEIKKHTIWGWEILSNIVHSPTLRVGAHYHHEKFDGTGYPEGLAGEDIPEFARIIAVADAYDAMTSTRSYRDTMQQAQVRSEIENGIGSQFDPKFAKIMLEMIDEDPEYKMKEQPK